MVTSTFPFTETLLKLPTFETFTVVISVAETLVENTAVDKTIAVKEDEIRVLIEVFIIF